MKFTPAAASLSNNAVNTIFNSTYGLMTAPSATVVGTLRGRYPRKRIAGWILATTQDVTARLDYLTEAGAWVTSFKTQTCAAGVEQPIDWLPVGAEWRVVVVNGATGPSALTFNGFGLYDNPDAGT